MELRGRGYSSGVRKSILTFFSGGIFLPRYEVFGGRGVFITAFV